jgi:outer membrane immunogenic protein
MWQEGRLIYGVIGGFDYLAATGGGVTPGLRASPIRATSPACCK